ncbi:hypothetical protein [Chitinophaga sp. YIM B06452]|uniref:hypothetical protein n=1 Tax=Chitinophaga sp. YIM B06452 TaxID=3082158 RepID=UPI0031FE9E0C
MEKWMQIDVKQIGEVYTMCNLYADGYCVPVVMKTEDYQLLHHKGFFVRPQNKPDTAGALNTSDTYYTKT